MPTKGNITREKQKYYLTINSQKKKNF